MYRYNKIYLPYKPEANINYIYLFCLYGIAERYDQNGIKQDIGYRTIKDLHSKICEYQKTINKDADLISYSTVQRFLKNPEYKDFFTIDKRGAYYWLYLNNDFSKVSKNYSQFIVLNTNTYKYLIQQQDNLLAKYTIYIKCMCGLGKGQSDFTADQFFSAFGYSGKSNNLRDIICGYNKQLEEAGIIKIYRNTLQDGKRRNTYTFIDI